VFNFDFKGTLFFVWVFFSGCGIWADL